VRFNRDYELKIEVRGGEVTILPPIRVSFQADKSVSGQLNKLQLKIYNLAEKNRLAIVKDAEEVRRIPLSLAVGYQGRLELMFKGTIHRCGNSRQGPDIITTIEGLDGGFDLLNSFTSRTVKGGQRALDSVMSDMANTTIGKTNERPVLSRPKILVGNSIRLIEETIKPGESWYIDDEKLYIIADNEVTTGFVTLVSSDTGLISTPERTFSKVTFQTLMNPAVKIGRRVNLISTTAPHLNGVYKINTISYQGDNYGSEWSQTCTGLLSPDAVVL
jgi:hypothetical protein